ncbi:MAG: leucyl aminopeptidase [Gemmataceae bacterium]|nr:leucyl aminopeptidase [Gemmataceae bacterium]
MQFTTQFAPPHEVQADWLVVGLWEDEPLGGPLAGLDARMERQLSRLVERGDIAAKPKETTPLYEPRGLAADRALVVGLGPRAKSDQAGLFNFGAVAARTITTKACERVACVLPEGVPNLDRETIAALVGSGLWHGSEGAGLRKTKPDRFAPKEFCLVASSAEDRAVVERGARRAEVEGRAVSLARELVNLPPCDLYPETFADRARHVAQQTGIECMVLDERDLAAERMHALLAVARGSDRPPRLVVLRYQGRAGAATLGLVGKGVTFDSGGLSLKTTEQMVDMKCDMAGAAAVLSATQALVQQKVPVNIVGLLALVENLPSGKAMKLGDVLHARNGKTIEVLNTDAEGRLILADALGYAVDQRVNHLVDLATLTGSCIVALGMDVAGLMSNDDAWSARVHAAARAAGERLWPLPMDAQYSEMIKSDVADIKNTGGSRWAGAISAAKFLEEFVGGTPWAHLDIAGPAWAEKDNAVRSSGGTGFGVRTLTELARRYAE